jgi:hypothetical protein
MSILRNILLITSCSLLLAACTSSSNPFYYAYDKGDCKSNRFDEVDRNLDLSVQWKFDTIYLKWTQYSEDDFNGYYLVRTEGESNTCPFYFSGSDYLHHEGKQSRTYYKDDSVVSGDTYYYRLCVKETDKEVNCGGVKKVSVY